MQNAIKSYLKSLSKTDIALTAILLIQLSTLFIFNLTRTQYITDFDSSAAMAQAMEIVKQKSLFIKNWSYQSTLGLDSVLPLAALFYAISGNIFISYGMADFVGTLFFLYVITSTLKLLNVNKTFRYLACVFLLIPFSQGMLGYAPMMFTGAAYYLLKAVYPILFASLIIRINRQQFDRYHIALIIILLWLSFFTGFSCQSYLLVCGIAPVLLWQIINRIINSEYTGNITLKMFLSADIILSITAAVLCMAGMYVGKVYYNYSFTNGMVLCNVSNFFDNLTRMIIGHFELFGAVAYGDITATSFQGITILIHLLITILFITLLIVGIKTFVKKILSSNVFAKDIVSEDNTNNSYYDYGYFFMIIIINYIILILTYTTYGAETYEFRYLIIPMVAEVFICCMTIEHIRHIRVSSLLHNTLITSTALVMLILSLLEWNNYTKINNNSDYLKNISDSLINNSYDIALYMDDDNSKETEARILRLFSPELNVVYINNRKEFRGWGTSTEFFDENAIKQHNYYIFK